MEAASHVREALVRIQTEYVEMPHLKLTARQVQTAGRETSGVFPVGEPSHSPYGGTHDGQLETSLSALTPCQAKERPWLGPGPARNVTADRRWPLTSSRTRG